jgi:hypothetical protein
LACGVIGCLVELVVGAGVVVFHNRPTMTPRPATNHSPTPPLRITNRSNRLTRSGLVHHESHQSFSRWDSIRASVGEWHQLTDPTGQPNLLEENDETHEATKGRDGLLCGSEADLPSGKNRVTNRALRQVCLRFHTIGILPGEENLAGIAFDCRDFS